MEAAELAELEATWCRSTLHHADGILIDVAVHNAIQTELQENMCELGDNVLGEPLRTLLAIARSDHAECGAAELR